MSCCSGSIIGSGQAEPETRGIDPTTGAAITISNNHSKIHDGSHYYVSGFETEDEDGTIKFTVLTPDTTKWAHMTFVTQGTSRTEFRVYEGATATGGAAAAPINNNRNSSNTSVLTVAKDPTVTVTGTLIYSQSLGLEAATPSKASLDGLVDHKNEIILKQDTKYLFEITSKADDNIISYLGEWYEHTNKATIT